MFKLNKVKFLSVISKIIMICIIISCNQAKFEKNKWNDTNDPVFPSSYRPKMLNDLIKNHKLIGLHYSQLIDSLGKPDNKENSSIVYRINIDYKDDIDPVYTKNLIFFYSKDSLITSYKIVEWKK